MCKCVLRGFCKAFQTISDEDSRCNVMENCKQFQEDDPANITLAETFGLIMDLYESETGNEIFTKGFEEMKKKFGDETKDGLH